MSGLKNLSAHPGWRNGCRDFPDYHYRTHGAEDIQAAYTAGATDYIRKPCHSARLLARVATALSLKQEIDETPRAGTVGNEQRNSTRAFEQITHAMAPFTLRQVQAREQRGIVLATD